MLPVFPFTAIVGQDRMRLALILNAISPQIGGVLIRGERGTAKSTAARALAALLPKIETVTDCPFNCDPHHPETVCDNCRERMTRGETLPVTSRRTRFVDLPVSATEDRVVGTLDIEHALKTGEKRFEPGLLAAAHRGILYADEVNLLDDHIVDILLDSAAMGKNTVEREGVSFTHPARFVLVGTMNPEEGELRPQLLDRFGLCVQIKGIDDPQQRVSVMERRTAFDENPEAFSRSYSDASTQLSDRIRHAIARYGEVSIDQQGMLEIARLCVSVGVDGHRADIVSLKTAKTLCAYEGRKKVTNEDINRAAEMALPHRVRRQPFEEIADGPLEFGRGLVS